MDEIKLSFELRFFIALGLSFLVGLERESSSARDKGKAFSGVRTYSLIGVLGFGCAWMSQVDVPWMLPIGLLCITALAINGYAAKMKAGYVGWTSEVAMLNTFIVGGLCLIAEIWVPLALGIVGTFLLSEKSYLEKYVERLDKTEFLAVIKFLIVSIIILPILPNEEYSQFSLNPRQIWIIVVLVSSVGFVGYFLSKKYGQRVGLWLSGLLGGIVSSTAVSFAMGRIAQRNPVHSINAMQASILAGSIMYLRVLGLIFILRPEYFVHFWWKLVALSIIGLILALTIKTDPKQRKNPEVNNLHNPFEIRPALLFAVLFLTMSVITVVIKQYYGDTGLFVLSAVIGVTDIDPFILSLIAKEMPYQTLMVTAIIISMMSNTVAKGIYFGSMAKTVRSQTYIRYGIWALLHLPLIFLPS